MVSQVNISSNSLAVGPRADRLGTTGLLDNSLAPAIQEDQETNSLFPNVLSSFTSYSCILTFGMLTTNELNDPDNTYRTQGPQRIIARSGGSGSKQIPTAYEKEFGITTEYFIDDVEIQSILAPNSQTRQTNATLINFKLQEPYSMGNLLQTLAVTAFDAYPERAANENSNLSYIDVPYILGVQFVGWNDDGTYVEIPNTTRWIPLRLSGIEFSVGTEGTTYDVNAYAYNEIALIDEIQTVLEDVQLRGSTIADFLQIEQDNLSSLTGILNERQLAEKDAENRPEPDQYVIAFPKNGESLSAQITAAQEQNQGATVTDNQSNDSVTASSGVTLDQIKEIVEDPGNINEIGLSKLSTDPFDTGTRLMGRPEDVEAEIDGVTYFERGAVRVRQDLLAVTFKWGMRIQEIIEELILMSAYGEQLVNEPSDDQGRKKYFRIETDVYNQASQENERKRKRSAKIFVFKVIPYKVSEFYFNHPATITKGIDKLRALIPKSYDYIYTGKNDDIINFDLNFNHSFYAGIRYDFGQLSSDSILNRSNEEQVTYRAGDGNNDTSEPSPPLEGRANANNGERGPSGDVPQSPANQIARDYNDLILNSPSDLITLDLEIWGDPYYIADSGIGNYTSKSDTTQPQTTIDRTVDYQNNEPYLIINFKTPVDYDIENESSSYGQMKFPEIGGETVSQFSGIYKINLVTNNISANKFTQSLQLTRLRNQSESGGDSALAVPGNTNNLISNLVNNVQASSGGSE